MPNDAAITRIGVGEVRRWLIGGVTTSLEGGVPDPMGAIASGARKKLSPLRHHQFDDQQRV